MFVTVDQRGGGYDGVTLCSVGVLSLAWALINLCSTRVTGVGSIGYAGDLTPPTIYVEEILICISHL